MAFDEVNTNLAFIKRKYFNRIPHLYKLLLYVAYLIIDVNYLIINSIKVLIERIGRRKGEIEFLNKKYKKKEVYRYKIRNVISIY